MDVDDPQKIMQILAIIYNDLNFKSIKTYLIASPVQAQSNYDLSWDFDTTFEGRSRKNVKFS